MSSAHEGTPTAIPKRAAAALTEVMTVLEDLPEVAGDSETMAVVSASGRQYEVDLRADTCTCHDMLHRRPDEGCKHLLRAKFARGERVVPSWVDVDAVDEDLGRHVSGTPLIRAGGRSVPLGEFREAVGREGGR